MPAEPGISRVKASPCAGGAEGRLPGAGCPECALRAVIREGSASQAREMGEGMGWESQRLGSSRCVIQSIPPV